MKTFSDVDSHTTDLIFKIQLCLYSASFLAGKGWTTCSRQGSILFEASRGRAERGLLWPQLPWPMIAEVPSVGCAIKILDGLSNLPKAKRIQCS